MHQPELRGLFPLGANHLYALANALDPASLQYAILSTPRFRCFYMGRLCDKYEKLENGREGSGASAHWTQCLHPIDFDAREIYRRIETECNEFLTPLCLLYLLVVPHIFVTLF